VPARIRVLVADDHPVVRAGLATVIAQEADLELVAEAENGARAVTLFREHHPDVVLMDLRMPVIDGVEAIRTITAEYPAARILALTTYEGDGDIRRALEVGAWGYLLKDMLLTEVITAVRAVHRGERVIPPAVAVRLAEHPPGSDLTERELEVLKLVAGPRVYICDACVAIASRIMDGSPDDSQPPKVEPTFWRRLSGRIRGFRGRRGKSALFATRYASSLA